MKGSRERGFVASSRSSSTTDSPNRSFTSDSSELGSADTKFSKPSLWSTFFASAFSVFDTHRDSSSTCEKPHTRHGNGWTSAVKKIVAGGSMRRNQECVLGTGKTGISNTTSDIWLLGACYRISQDNSSGDDAAANALAAFNHDFASRILITYRKGFDAIEDSKLTSDGSWGCMLRSSQMLVAQLIGEFSFLTLQALLFHRLGRSWRKPLDKPLDREYVEILHLFGDSESSTFSIHNLLRAGKAYGLAAGSWVGPYAVCHSWESLVHSKREETNLEYQSLQS
ncbi:hypothetical protein DKX38_026387 [Salix brachista]|uniref:Cysteine protease n=1 Tax=Salix brachista TaxID=2182728 RepID=A0A5N5J9D1_9ROSI|nr:hypothetical protein DKX38_026387 [Salix brachista]